MASVIHNIVSGSFYLSPLPSLPLSFHFRSKMAAPVTTSRPTFQATGIEEGKHSLHFLGMNQKWYTSLLFTSHDQDLVTWLNLAARKARNIVSS